MILYSTALPPGHRAAKFGRFSKGWVAYSATAGSAARHRDPHGGRPHARGHRRSRLPKSPADPGLDRITPSDHGARTLWSGARERSLRRAVGQRIEREMHPAEQSLTPPLDRAHRMLVRSLDRLKGRRSGGRGRKSRLAMRARGTSNLVHACRTYTCSKHDGDSPGQRCESFPQCLRTPRHG